MERINTVAVCFLAGSFISCRVTLNSSGTMARRFIIQESDFRRVQSLGFANLYYRLKLLVKFPSAIPKLFGEREKTLEHIDMKIRSEFQRSPQSLVKRRGVYVYLNSKDPWISSYIQVVGAYDMESTLLLESLLKEGDVVFDVGANIGWHTLVSAKMVKRIGRIYAFEPEPINFSLLSKSIAYNAFQNVELFNCCVADYNGEVELFLNEDNPGDHSITWTVGAKSIRVPCSKLDTIAVKYGLDHIDLLKMDIEGAEPKALSGASDLLDQGKIERMLVEYSPGVWRDYQGMLTRLFHDYEVFSVNSRPLSPFKRTSLDSLPRLRTNLYMSRKCAD